METASARRGVAQALPSAAGLALPVWQPKSHQLPKPPKKARPPRQNLRHPPSPRPAPSFPTNGATVTAFQVAPTRVRGMTVRAFPTVEQAQRLNQLIGQGRYVYNFMRGLQNTPAPEEGTWLNKAGWSALNRAVTDLLAQAREQAAKVLLHPGDPSKWGPHYWLADCPRTLITQKYNDLKQGWSNHLANPGHFGAPTFKKRSSQDAIRIQVDMRQYDREIHLHERQWLEAGHAMRAPCSGQNVLFDAPIQRRSGSTGSVPQDPSHIWVKIPKVGQIRVELTEPVHGEVVSMTISRRSGYHKSSSTPEEVWRGYEISLTLQAVPVDLDKPKNWSRRLDWEADALANGGAGKLGSGLGSHDPAGVVALDASMTHRMKTSNGDALGRRDRDPITAPKVKQKKAHSKCQRRRLSKQQRHRRQEAGFALFNEQTGQWSYPVLPKRETWTDAQKAAMMPSQRQKKLEQRLAKQAAAERRQALHDAHVFTTWLVLHFHTIVVEGLTLKDMARSLSKGFRRSFNEAAMGQILRMLAYKCDLYGRTLVVANRWFPSSKQCWVCHQINPTLKLADRTWPCPCGQDHDRDQTATFNLWQYGCDAVGIDRGAHLTPLTTGESPAAGREGFLGWGGAKRSCSPHPRRCSVNPKPGIRRAKAYSGRMGDRLTMSGSTSFGVRD